LANSFNTEKEQEKFESFEQRKIILLIFKSNNPFLNEFFFCKTWNDVLEIFGNFFLVKN
jgi:hypothetical protein